MIQKNKKMIAVTSVVTLLPVFIGLCLWNRLPDMIAIHFGMNNQPNEYSPKIFAVVGLPATLLIVHFFCIITTSIDPKVKNINQKILRVILWICPITSLFVCSGIYGYSLGYPISADFMVSGLLGMLYLVLGNFIPTVRPNHTVGFRIPWTMNDSDNWYHTHRFAGKCMVIGGILAILTMPFHSTKLILTLLVVPGLLPVVYSYLYYRKNSLH